MAIIDRGFYTECAKCGPEHAPLCGTSCGWYQEQRVADNFIRFPDGWYPGTPTIKTYMDTCAPANAYPPIYLEYEPPTRKVRIEPPACEWCGVPSEDDKFHPGTCGECGGPR